METVLAFELVGAASAFSQSVFSPAVNSCTITTLRHPPRPSTRILGLCTTCSPTFVTLEANVRSKAGRTPGSRWGHAY